MGGALQHLLGHNTVMTLHISTNDHLQNYCTFGELHLYGTSGDTVQTECTVRSVQTNCWEGGTVLLVCGTEQDSSAHTKVYDTSVPCHKVSHTSTHSKTQPRSQ